MSRYLFCKGITTNQRPVHRRSGLFRYLFCKGITTRQTYLAAALRCLTTLSVRELQRSNRFYCISESCLHTYSIMELQLSVLVGSCRFLSALLFTHLFYNGITTAIGELPYISMLFKYLFCKGITTSVMELQNIVKIQCFSTTVRCLETFHERELQSANLLTRGNQRNFDDRTSREHLL